MNLDGERDVLGLWLGPSGGEGAKQWMSMLTELRNRGVSDALIVCCDELKGLPDAIRVNMAARDGPDVRRSLGAQQSALRLKEVLGKDRQELARYLHRPDRRGR